MAQGAGVDATIHDVDLELGTTWDTLGNTEILGVLDDEIEDDELRQGEKMLQETKALGRDRMQLR